jgi:hypothetical protein
MGTVGGYESPALIKIGLTRVSSIIALVMEAGVGQPDGVLGFRGILEIRPFAISSASRTGVSSVFSGVGPAPEIPGTMERRVFASIPQKTGFEKVISGILERNTMMIRSYVLPVVLLEYIGALHFTSL